MSDPVAPLWILLTGVVKCLHDPFSEYELLQIREDIGRDHRINTRNRHTSILGLHALYSPEGILGLTLATPISAITVTFPREDSELNTCFRELMEDPTVFKYGLHPERIALFLFQNYGHELSSLYEINVGQRKHLSIVSRYVNLPDTYPD